MYYNRRPLSCQPALLLLVLLTLTTPTLAQQTITEDFEDGDLASIDPFFEFTFDDIAGVDFLSFPDSNNLFLSKAGPNPNQLATVTFSLNPGQQVQNASIDLADASGGGPETSVRFVGTLGTALFSTDTSLTQQFETFNTDGLGLGAIQKIELLPSAESHYDNLIVTVVPEPSSVVLSSFILAALAMRRGLRYRGETFPIPTAGGTDSRPV